MDIRRLVSVFFYAVVATGLFLVGVARAQQPVWADEFEGPRGGPPDLTKWVHELGASGWGNDELQEYTNSRENSFLDGKGNLVIKAVRKGSSLDNNIRYTSARLNTKGKYAAKFGRVEARMKLPHGQGIWPAFWMLGNDFPTVPWPQSGEIDILEMVGHTPDTVHGTLHGPGYSGAEARTHKLVHPNGEKYSGEFHVYGVDWREDRIQFQVDGATFFEFTKANVPAGKEWVFNRPFYLLLNLAVGGRWPGYPDHTTKFPQELVVDWVRVYP